MTRWWGGRTCKRPFDPLCQNYRDDCDPEIEEDNMANSLQARIDRMELEHLIERCEWKRRMELADAVVEAARESYSVVDWPERDLVDAIAAYDAALNPD